MRISDIIQLFCFPMGGINILLGGGGGEVGEVGVNIPFIPFI